MTMNHAVFDKITNSEDEMIKRAGIKRKDACVYLRAYMIVRLLFYHELVISDSSINLNQALRTLILADENKTGVYDLSKLPHADFGDLIEKGFIKLAVRDIYKGSFSERLRAEQLGKKYVDKPSEQYTEFIDTICKEENIYWWNAEEVSRMFTRKIRKEFETEYSDEMNLYLRELSNRLSNQEILTYSMIKENVLKKYKETSDEYQLIHSMLRRAYDDNLSEVLKLDYFKFFNSSPQLMQDSNIEITLNEQYEIPWKYRFNIYDFALLPTHELMLMWSSDEYLRYETALSQLEKDPSSFQPFVTALEKYLDLIDYVLVSIRGNRDITNKPRNIVAQFREYINGTDSVVIAVKLLQSAMSAVDVCLDIRDDPLKGILGLALIDILPNIIIKKREKFVAMPEIRRAIVKVDK